MKDLILADIIRILRKPTYRGTLIVVFIITLSVALRTRFNVWNGFTYASNQYTMQSLVMELVMAVMIFLSVYADEFTSNSMQTLIGHGVSRFKLLLAKFIDCVIVTVFSYMAYMVFVLLLGLVMGAGISLEETGFLASGIMAGAVKTIGFATVSMIVLYWTKNVAFATLADIILTAAAPLIFDIFKKIPAVKFLHLENRLFPGVIDCARASLMLGDNGAILTILWELIKVCAVSILISYLLFKDKELEF